MVAVIFEEGQRVPVLTWGRAPDPAAVRQLRLLASQPHVVGRVAGMPDLHVSSGVAVGSVFATERHVLPGALGGDLGCGMCAVRFSIDAVSIEKRELRVLLGELGRAIPVGDEEHAAGGARLPDELSSVDLSTRALSRARDRVGPRQLGTLGGGNHFLELERDAGGRLWVMVHSGSRGMGGAVARHHLAAAGAAGGGALGALDAEGPAGASYLRDHAWALGYARENRRALLGRAAEVIGELLGASAEASTLVDVHHNFVAREEHEGRSLLVHRKGAIRAARDEAALVPGSMGTASYLVRGLGEPRSFGSSSHGAGRVMTRSEARRRVSGRALERAMGRVVFDARRVSALVEEAPEAYRDIREVLEDERDLVEPVLRFEPVAVLKG